MPVPEADFASFVEARWPALWRSAWALTGDSHRAEDLVQTALLKVWPHWSRVVAGGDPEKYVRRVLFTTYAAWWRRRWNGELPVDSVPDRAGDDETSHVAMRHELLSALAALPRGQRAVVVCRHLDDLTESQTAELLDCSVGTVKSQHARAMTRLRGLLSDTEPVGPEEVR